MEKLTALFWSYGLAGAELSAVLSALGTLLTGIFGDWDNMLQSLILFMSLDFILGFLSACKSRTVNSQIMLWGGVNKVLVLALVAVGVRLDLTLELREPICRTAICWFYMAREGLSMIENSGKLGFPWPAFLTNMLEQMKTDSDRKGGLPHDHSAGH